jgi:tryptophanyl-tRNA synthetase
MKVKKFLNAVLQETLEPIRTRREELAKNLDAVWEMLYQGSKKAREVAGETLAQVKRAMKINYFENRE